jgi:hypothetical protein
MCEKQEVARIPCVHLNICWGGYAEQSCRTQACILSRVQNFIMRKQQCEIATGKSSLLGSYVYQSPCIRDAFEHGLIGAINDDGLDELLVRAKNCSADATTTMPGSIYWLCLLSLNARLTTLSIAVHTCMRVLQSFLWSSLLKKDPKRHAAGEKPLSYCI